ncbi:hypothetical protein POM88_023879 [Heracleum sosnowskyi]|uniref:DUF4218 domain-containing protein n=1 Tax=Heracleum sosnowskyi TaxID=360622 RepID=A0AAD8IJI1_9APIA|nr:hypothetical protein POM88_023879 [Heracleum sosnowskyi]
MDDEEITWTELPKKVLHPVKSSDGQYLEIRAAIFDMTNKEKEIFCLVLEKAKLPYGCAANISRYVHTKERIIWGYKSHDAHFLLHYLLQFAVKKTLKPEVAVPLIRLGAFLRSLWSKVIDLAELNRLEKEIVEILCHFEMIFPTTFFDIMIHLLVHLCKEIKLGGPSHLRCMWPIEHYLCKLKSYVRNRSKPEGSIAEGYLAEECLTFCSRFLNSDVVPKFERCPQKDVENLIEEHRCFLIKWMLHLTTKPKRQFVTTHQLQQQKKSKKPAEVYSPRKSARLNNAQGIIPNEVKSSRKPALLKNPRQGRGENVDVTSARKSERLVSAKPEISVDAALKQKPKSTEAEMPKSANVRRKLDLHNPRDEGEDIDGDENMDENDIEDEDLPPQDDMNEEATNSVLVEHPAKTQLPCIQGIGSMADYLAMRELRQKKAAEAVTTGSGTKTDKVPETDLPDIENEEAEAAIFAKTRKRKPGREYKYIPDVMQFRVDTINKKLQSAEGLDGLDELVLGGKKSHGPGWLIGRHDVKCVKASTQNTAPPAPTDSYIQELKKKLRQEVVEEVEAKLNQKVNEEVDVKVNQKVQDNLTLVLKKIVDANPFLNINIGEICATISSDTGGDGTPMTNRPSS